MTRNMAHRPTPVRDALLLILGGIVLALALWAGVVVVLVLA